jgi:predicted PolB exonuclease-like 3'-5' exonuclease
MNSDHPEAVLVWDLETVPDFRAFAVSQGHLEWTDQQAREALGSGFPKLPLHKIICIGALIAFRGNSGWQVRSYGAPHIGERSEYELIQSFVDRIEELRPKLVTFNGSSFDLPVLRYRAMLHSIAAPGLGRRPYFNRYTDDATDLCDVLASFDARAKPSLNELSRILGFAGKPDGMSGGDVEKYFNAGEIQKISDYCEADVINTYRVWLKYELFRGALTKDQYVQSDATLINLVLSRNS